MSVINKMLQELDRRNAVGAGNEIGAQPVKPVGSGRQRHETFWRITAALVLISVAWVGWVAYQLQPRTLFTPLAKAAAIQQQAQQEAQPQPAPPEPQVALAPKPEPVVEPPKPEAPKQEEPAETFKLARTIETPISEPKPRVAPAPKAETRKPAPKAAVGPTKIVVDKRERSKGVSDPAEAYFRRAAGFLNQGRVSEAEEQLASALYVNPRHVPARQAYVALLLEQQRVDAASKLLREAVELNPPQPAFLIALARIHAEQRDYRGALQVLDKAAPDTQGTDFQVLRAAVLQRMGRHAEAVTFYESAAKSAPQQGGHWTGLAISLEALGRRAEAAQAYQRALGTKTLPAQLREYAEARVKALQ